MKTFHFAGDNEYINDALAGHGAKAHGVRAGDVRGCKPVGAVSHCVAQASERHDPSESAGILDKAGRHVLTLRVALAAALAMLSDARAALPGKGDGVADPRLGEGEARGPLGAGDPRTGDGPRVGCVEDPRTGEVDGFPDDVTGRTGVVAPESPGAPEPSPLCVWDGEAGAYKPVPEYMAAGQPPFAADASQDPAAGEGEKA